MQQGNLSTEKNQPDRLKKKVNQIEKICQKAIYYV